MFIISSCKNTLIQNTCFYLFVHKNEESHKNSSILLSFTQLSYIHKRNKMSLSGFLENAYMQN